MTCPRIALFGKPQDVQLQAAASAVKAEGGDPLMLEIGLLETGSPRVTLGSQALTWDGRDFSAIDALYIRGMAPNTLPSLPPVLNATLLSEWRTRYVREQEYQAFSYSFFELLSQRGKLVANRLSTYLHHNSKAQFYERMRAKGFCFPPTLTTTDPERARQFADAMGEVVVKPGIGVGSTRRLLAHQLDRTEDFGLCPVTMQKFISGKTLRVHIVADKVVLALRILSDGTDSRTATKGFEYTRLPEAEEAKLAAANRELGLHFAAWDVIVSDDGKVYYLDCNPGPFVMWIGPEFVQAVFTQLARCLIAFSRTHDMKQAAAAVERHIKN